jgi:glycosyltransferase involved in cell wall biosynthesis
MAKVSVCIITYNQEAFINECIEGAVKQSTNFEFEIIIGDDCSSDMTSKICKNYALKYPEIIKYNRRERNLGMIGNWIATIKECTGEFIALCEGDDFWTDPYKLQKQVDFLEENPEYVLCFHPVKLLEPDGRIVSDYITNIPENYETIEAMAANGNYIHTPSVVFRNVIKTFPDQIKQSPIGDYFLYMLLGVYGNYGMLKDEMGVYRYQTGVWSQHSKQYRNLNTLLTLLLIHESLAVSLNHIKNILYERIKKYFNALLPFLSEKELQRIRIDNEISELIDKLILELFIINQKGHIHNIDNLTLFKLFFKRGLTKLKKLYQS